MEKVAYGVPGIDEEGAALIRKRLERLPGVQSVTTWTSEQQVDVTYDPEVIRTNDLVDAIRDLGYLAEFIQWGQRAPG